MISLAHIESWVRGGESETLEWKRSTGEKRAATQTLCGMLNHRGGRILFGVEPDGRIRGQTVTDHTIEDLSQELANIEPPVFPSVERVDCGKDRQLVIVTVNAGSTPPYSYRGQAYRRIGNTTRELSREEYNRILLERLHSQQRWENQVAEGWTVADLECSEIVRTLEESIRRGRVDDPGTRAPEEILRGLGLMRGDQLVRAAVVLFGSGNRLEAEMPQCLLRVAKFRGIDKTEFLDNRQFHGNVFDLLRKAERFLRENLPVAGRVRPDLFERVDDPVYPPVALREALANAVAHRDYSIGGGSIAVAVYDNRLEITSSGMLHFGLTPDLLFLPHESLPWNPLIARVLYRRGVIESWGRGTLKMAELTTQAGLPRPDIEESGGCVLVRFSPSRYLPPQRVAKDVTERQRAILTLMDDAVAGIALRDVLAKLEIPASERQVRDDLAALRMLGLAQPIGHGRSARWRKVV
jgi:ATP-dependent DNA helicase RecG